MCDNSRQGAKRVVIQERVPSAESIEAGTCAPACAPGRPLHAPRRPRRPRSPRSPRRPRCAALTSLPADGGGDLVCHLLAHEVRDEREAELRRGARAL